MNQKGQRIVPLTRFILQIVMGYESNVPARVPFTYTL
jgi:hypothetical protein